MHLNIYTDGGARGNPGPAAIGVVIKDDFGIVLQSYGAYLGEQTNNFAEYSALISGLKKAQSLGATDLDCYLDSELVVKQMKREYKVREPELQKLFIQAYNCVTSFKTVSFKHIPREKNQEADKMVNETLDKNK